MSQAIRNSFEFITLEERVNALEQKIDDLAFAFLQIEDNSFRWDLMGFGYKIVGTTVTIYSGEIQIGTNTPVIAVTTNRGISADYQYIWVEMQWTDFIAYIPAASTVKPSSSSTVFRKWLYRFRLINGLVSIDTIGNMGNIHIHSYYGG